MKKVILIILLIGIIVALTGCSNSQTTDLSKLSNERQAIIIMPDGSLIRGKCTNFLRFNDNWVYAKINGTKYYADSWRIIMWEND